MAVPAGVTPNLRSLESLLVMWDEYAGDESGWSARRVPVSSIQYYAGKDDIECIVTPAKRRPPSHCDCYDCVNKK